MNINHIQVRKINVNRVPAFSELRTQHLPYLSKYWLPRGTRRIIPTPPIPHQYACALIARTCDYVTLHATFYWSHLVDNYFASCLICYPSVLVAQSCQTLCSPMDCSLPGSSVHGILQARIPEWVTILFSRVSSQPRDRTWVSHIAGSFFVSWATREAILSHLLPIWHCAYLDVPLLLLSYNLLRRILNFRCRRLVYNQVFKSGQGFRKNVTFIHLMNMYQSSTMCKTLLLPREWFFPLYQWVLSPKNWFHLSPYQCNALNNFIYQEKQNL